MPRNRVVQQLPSTASVEDPQVRAYLDALTNAWQLRNGDIGDEQHRFITLEEFDRLARDSITGFFTGGPGGGGPTVGRPPGRIQNIIDSLAQEIFASQLFRELGESIRRISAPWDTIDYMDGLIQKALKDIQIIENGITRIDSVIAGTVSTVEAINTRVGDAEASIIQINTVSATSTSANALALFQLIGRVGNAEADITELNTITLTSTSALASSFFRVRASWGNVLRTYFQAEAPVSDGRQTGDQWFDTDDGGKAYYWNGTQWVEGSLGIYQYADAGILTEQTARVTKDTALATAINHIWATVGGTSATIQDGSFVSATAAQTAFAQRWTTVQSAVYNFNTNTNLVAALDQRFTTTVSQIDGKLRAAYTLRVEVGPDGDTTVGGFGLAGSYSASEGPLIDFGVRADRFWIANPQRAGAAPRRVAPFIVRTDSGWWGDPGVYIDTAVIAKASIGIANIEQEIKSTNFVAGTRGWFINSHTGDAEFNNVRIRGTSTVGRLNIEGAVEHFVDVPNNGTASVVHNENRRVVVTMWSGNGTPNLTDMTLNSFTIRLDFSQGGRVYYRYF